MAELDLMNEDNKTELTDDKMDELVSRAENQPSRGREIPMTKEEPVKEEPQFIEFDHKGKKIKGTQDQLIKWAQMGIDYPQRAQQLNQEKAKWEQQKQQWESKWGEYAKVDEWAKQNPSQWDRLRQSWSQMQQGQVPGQTQTQAPTNDLTYQELQSLKQKLSQLEPVIQTINQDFTSSKQQAEDQALDGQIQSIREKHKNLDWDMPDENGKPLEYRVLEFAEENGIKNFDTAFKAYYHDELVKMAQVEAKQNVSKDIQTKTKMGILGQTPTPKRGIQSVKDVKNKSYNEIEQEIREELRSGAYG